MEELLGRLEEEPVKNIKFKEGWIHLEYDGTKIKNYIVVEKHQKCIGRWDTQLHAVYVDDDLDEMSRKAIAVHESIEKYVSQKYDLDPYKEAHDIATIKEREFLEENDGDWRSHQIKVGLIWKKESEVSH